MKQPDKYTELKDVIRQIFHENRGRYGYRRITMELHNRGYHVNHKTVQKLMKQCSLKCEIRRRKYRSYKGEVGKVAPNELKRNFYAENRIKNGLRMLQSLQYKIKRYTYRQFLIYIMVK